jgi:flagellar motor switch protein FliM
MKVISIEEQRYFEFSNALEDFVMMGSISIQPKDEELSDAMYLLQFSNSISLSIIDRMMGGQGTFVDIDRDFTEIEIGLIRRVMTKMAHILKESWADYLDVETDLVGIETNSRLNKSISSDETIVLVTFELEINDISNMVAMIVPAVSMGEMMNKFSNKSKRINKHFDPNREMEIRRSLLNRVSRSNLNINAVLSQTQIELGELLMLQPEDIIYLDMGINENVSVNVSGLPWYEGKMGTVNNRKSIKIIGLDQKQMR